MAMSRRFFYLLIIVAIVVALFFSTLLGLIILVGDILYYFFLGRNKSTRQISSTPAVDMITEIQQPVKEEVSCKYCGALVDPSNDKACPTCGAPIAS